MYTPIYPHRFELFNIGHKVIIISVIPSFVSDRYSQLVQHTPRCNTMDLRVHCMHVHACTGAHVHAQCAYMCTDTCSTTSFLLVAFLIEYISVLVTSHLRPFVEPSLDRLNMGTLVVTCLVLFYGYTDVRLHALTRVHTYACSIMLVIQPGAAEDPRDRQIQV